MTHAFFFKDNQYCRDCIVEVVIAAGLAPRSVLNDGPDAVLAQVAADRDIDCAWPEGFTSFVFPKVIFPVPPDLQCEGCGGPLMGEPVQTGKRRQPQDSEARLDAMADELADRFLAAWIVGPTTTALCADLVVLRSLRDAVEGCVPRYIHKALMAGAPVRAVARACGLSLQELEATWHVWATHQVQTRDGSGRPAMSLDDLHHVFGILTRR